MVLLRGLCQHTCPNFSVWCVCVCVAYAWWQMKVIQPDTFSAYSMRLARCGLDCYVNLWASLPEHSGGHPKEWVEKAARLAVEGRGGMLGSDAQ